MKIVIIRQYSFETKPKIRLKLLELGRLLHKHLNLELGIKMLTLDMMTPRKGRLAFSPATLSF